MWAGVFLWGSFASPDSPTGSALQPREGVHVHAGRPQKKSLARNIAGFLWECWDVPNSLELQPKSCLLLGFFYHFCLSSAWGNSDLLSPDWGLFRSKVVLVWIWSQLVCGRWIWLRVGTMSVIDILLVFSLKVHGCYFTTSFQEIDCKSMFFFLPRPYLQK